MAEYKVAAYKLGRRAPECAATGEAFEQGEEVVSAIFEGEEGFERRDFKVAAFPGEQASFSFWRGRVPVKEEDAQRLDFDLALEFFRRLVAENDPEQQGLRFLLGLLLGRKRRVKLKGFSIKGGQEWLNVVIRGDEEDEPVSVAVPKLDEQGRTALQADLNRLFGVEDAAGEEAPEDPTGAAPEGAPEAESASER